MAPASQAAGDGRRDIRRGAGLHEFASNKHTHPCTDIRMIGDGS